MSENPETFPTITTWEDLGREALHCPVLHGMMTLIYRGDCSREDALMAAILWLSRDRRRMMDKEVERLSMMPHRG